jgi:hypothetical protein
LLLSESGKTDYDYALTLLPVYLDFAGYINYAENEYIHKKTNLAVMA